MGKDVHSRTDEDMNAVFEMLKSLSAQEVSNLFRGFRSDVERYKREKDFRDCKLNTVHDALEKIKDFVPFSTETYVDIAIVLEDFYKKAYQCGVTEALRRYSEHSRRA